MVAPDKKQEFEDVHIDEEQVSLILKLCSFLFNFFPPCSYQRLRLQQWRLHVPVSPNCQRRTLLRMPRRDGPEDLQGIVDVPVVHPPTPSPLSPSTSQQSSGLD